MKTGTLQREQGFPVMKTGFSLWELAYREFPMSYKGFGFTAKHCCVKCLQFLLAKALLCEVTILGFAT